MDPKTNQIGKFCNRLQLKLKPTYFHLKKENPCILQPTRRREKIKCPSSMALFRIMFRFFEKLNTRIQNGKQFSKIVLEICRWKILNF